MIPSNNQKSGRKAGGPVKTLVVHKPVAQKFKQQPTRRGRRKQIYATQAYMEAFHKNQNNARLNYASFNNEINRKKNIDIFRIGVKLDHLDKTHCELASSFGCPIKHPHLYTMHYFANGDESMRAVEIERRKRLNLQKKSSSGGGAETRVTKLGMSDCIQLVLKYTVLETLTSIAATSASVKMNNCAYDVDTALASTSMPYFSEIAAFTGRSRVLNYHIQGKIVNNEAFPVAVLSMLTVSSIGATSVTETYAGNPHTSTAMLAAKGGKDECSIFRKASIMAIAGSKQAIYDDAYTSSNTSNSVLSSALTYAYISITSIAALTAVGVSLLLEVSMKTLMYRRISLLTREEDMFEEDDEKKDPTITEWRTFTNDEKKNKRFAMLQYLSEKNERWNARRDLAQPVAILDQLQRDYDELSERIDRLEKPNQQKKK